MLHVARGRGCAELPRQAARKAHPLASDVAARAAKELERARKIAELDADLLEQRVRVALDDREPFLAQDLGQRDVARDVGQGDRRPLGAGGAARLSAAARLADDGRGGFGHRRSLGRGRSFEGDIATAARRFEAGKLLSGTSALSCPPLSYARNRSCENATAFPMLPPWITAGPTTRTAQRSTASPIARGARVGGGRAVAAPRGRKGRGKLPVRSLIRRKNREFYRELPFSGRERPNMSA